MSSAAQTSGKAQVPKLRFAGFDGAWDSAPLSAHIESIESGVSVNSADRNAGMDEKAILKTSCVSGGIFEPSKNKAVIDTLELSRLKSPIRRDTIIMSRMNTPALVGANAYVSEDHPNIFLPDRLWALDISAKSSAKFVSYILGNGRIRSSLTSLGTGTSGSMKNISQPAVLSLDISTPTLPEQKRIASFLSAVDEKIAQLTRKKELLEWYKKGCMQKIFSQTIRFTRNDGTPFPDWEIKRLDQLGSRSTEKNTDFEYSKILTNSATQGVVYQSDYFDNDIAKAANIDAYYIVRKGNFVYNPRISASAPVGPIKRNNLEDGVMSPLYTIFQLPKEYATFYEQYFNSALWFKYMKRVANYGARHDRMAISNGDFSAMPLPFPCLDEQQKVVLFLKAIDSKIYSATREMSHAKAFKRGLLQQMFV